MSLLLTILAFNLIIIVHELGHFLVAKLSKIKVLEFSMFIGPKIFSIKRGDTQYSIRLLPFLAYVKMEGEDEASDSKHSYSKRPLSIRAAVIFAGPFANILLAVLIFSVIFVINGFQTTTINSVNRNSSAYEAGIRANDKIIKYNGTRIFTPQNILEFLYASKGAPATVEVQRGEEILKTIIKPKVLPKNRFIIGFKPIAPDGVTSTVADTVDKTSPIGTAGIMKNDRIIALNNVPISNMSDILNYMIASKGDPINITIFRNNKEIVINNVVPKQTKNPETYEIGANFVFENGSLLPGISHALLFTYSTMRSTVYTMSWLIQGKVSIESLTGPVGIVSTMNEVAKQGENMFEKIISLLYMTAFISVAIGATNLIPFPALDGSKLLFIAIEKIRKKPIPIEKESAIAMIGFVLLLALAVFTTANDFIRIFSE